MATGEVGSAELPGRRMPPSHEVSSVAQLATAGNSLASGFVDSAGKAQSPASSGSASEARSGDVCAPPPPDPMYIHISPPGSVPGRDVHGFKDQA